LATQFFNFSSVTDKVSFSVSQKCPKLMKTITLFVSDRRKIEKLCCQAIVKLLITLSLKKKLRHLFIFRRAGSDFLIYSIAYEREEFI
jgi:hypothetical protein